MIRQAVTIEVGRAYLEHLANGSLANGGRGEVVLVLPRPGDKVLVSTKYFYPEGVYRLPSGSIRLFESPEEAFLRETWEETGLKPEIRDKIGVVVHHCLNGSTGLDVTSHIFLGSLTTDDPVPIDENERVRDYREVEARDLIEIADYLRSLFGRWLGFGRFRATAHDLVAHYLEKATGRVL